MRKTLLLPIFVFFFLALFACSEAPSGEQVKEKISDAGQMKDVGVKDTRPKDVGVKDTRPKDVGVKDTRSKDVGVKDTRPKDVGVKDVRPKDVGVKDTRPKDVGVKDTRPKDVGVRDTRLKDTRLKDTAPKDKGPAHTLIFSKTSMSKRYGDPRFVVKAKGTSTKVIQYSSDDRDVALVDPKTGEVRIVGFGQVKVIALQTLAGGSSLKASYLLKVQKIQGKIEFGQTHVFKLKETRIAPHLIGERNTLVLFIPDHMLAKDAALHLRVWNGNEKKASLRMRSHEELPISLESQITSVKLAPYSKVAWSVMVPWKWIKQGLHFEVLTRSQQKLQDVLAKDILVGAPSTYLLGRIKTALWGKDGSHMKGVDRQKLARDFFPSLPVAEIKWVEYKTSELPYVVTQTKNGPVRSDSSLNYPTHKHKHFTVLKLTLAQPIAKANYGGGLSYPQVSKKGNSPYAYSTHISYGLLYDKKLKKYRDMNDAGLAAGYTGWTVLWFYKQCGNGFIHELGHSYTLAHFSKGTAKRWKIEKEYPEDGRNLPTHPWGFDTERRWFRTTYTVKNKGPILDASNKTRGKRDPMNGGKDVNSITCFPQYTNYHARKIQNFFEKRPTFLQSFIKTGGVAKWDATSKSYVKSKPPEPYLPATAVGISVVTIVGNVGHSKKPTMSQIYPPFYASYGNTFQLPNPFGTGLSAVFKSAQYYLKMDYKTGSSRYALIAKPLISDEKDLARFSINLQVSRQPTKIHLYQASQAYPNIKQSGNKLLASQSIQANTKTPPLFQVGRGHATMLTLDQVCGAKNLMDCGLSAKNTSYALGHRSTVHFTLKNVNQGPIQGNASGKEGYTKLQVKVVDDQGKKSTLAIRASRSVKKAGQVMFLRLNDTMAVGDGAITKLFLWIDLSDNKHLALRKTYRSSEPIVIYARWTKTVGSKGVIEQIPVRVILNMPTALIVKNPTTLKPFVKPYSIAKTTVFFTTSEGKQGPTVGMWSGKGYTHLQIEAQDPKGNRVSIRLRAQRNSSGSGAGGVRVPMNAAAGRKVANALILWFDPKDNLKLKKGVKYTSIKGQELKMEIRLWHFEKKLYEKLLLSLEITP